MAKRFSPRRPGHLLLLCLLAVLPACENPEDEALASLQEANFRMTPADYLRAASIGDTEMLGHFLTAGMDVDTRGPDGGSALLVASERGHEDAVRLLLDAGADIDIRSRDGWTPLMTAAFNNRVPVVSLLLARGADPTKKDNSGWTALMQAVYKGHTQVAREIVSQTDEGLDRALLVAALMGHAEVARVLIDAGADKDSRTEENETPLMMAAQKGRLETVEMLLEAGVDTNLTNNVGDTAADLAMERGHAEIAALIQEAAMRQGRRDIADADGDGSDPGAADDPAPDAGPRADPGLADAGEDGAIAPADGSPSRVDRLDPDATPLPAVDAAGDRETALDPAMAAAAAEADREAALPVMSEEEWFRHHGLDLDDPAMLEDDPDGDGFTNAEEFVDNTDPHDSGSHPLHITKAVMIDYSSTEVPFVLEAVRDGTATVRRVDGGGTLTVREGDALGAFTVTGIRRRVISSKESVEADVSEVTLTERATGSETLLVRGQRARAGGSVATIQVPGRGGPVTVSDGQRFRLPVERGVEYQVFEVRPTQVVVRRVGGDATYTINPSGDSD